MSKQKLQEFDLSLPADNGLKRGRTTGTCAAAAVKAALLLMEHGEQNKSVNVTLPGGEYCLTVPISAIETLSDGSVRACVIKDAGDDPDQTNGATIFAIVKRNGANIIRFLAGSGVGAVTEPGISVAVGQPAINPVPREMMKVSVEEICGLNHNGFDLIIGCENGEQISKKTFNPRLGIVGGISILGTTGIVEPMSLAAYKASIEVYIRVALGNKPSAIAFRPGNIGISFARDVLRLPPKQIVHISNFIGFSLEATQRILAERNFLLPTLWVLGHPGKLAKVLDGIWETHSSKSSMAMNAVAKLADEYGFDQKIVKAIASCNSTEAVMDVLSDDSQAHDFWSYVERSIAGLMQDRLSNVDRVAVRLFSMNGTALGKSNNE